MTHKNWKKFTKLAILIFTPVAVVFFLAASNASNKESRVLGSVNISDTVDISAIVRGCLLEVTVFPEKRIPQIGNWDTEVTIEVYNSSNVLMGEVSVFTDPMGTGITDICSQGLFLTNGDYRFRTKGYSHLYKNFTIVNGFTTAANSEVLGGYGVSELFAGETSIIYDNYINSLDISTQIVNIFTADNKNDLNQDGIVNSLDVSNTIYNFFDAGEN